MKTYLKIPQKDLSTQTSYFDSFSLKEFEEISYGARKLAAHYEDTFNQLQYFLGRIKSFLEHKLIQESTSKITPQEAGLKFYQNEEHKRFYTGLLDFISMNHLSNKEEFNLSTAEPFTKQETKDRNSIKFQNLARNNKNIQMWIKNKHKLTQNFINKNTGIPKLTPHYSSYTKHKSKLSTPHGGTLSDFHYTINAPSQDPLYKPQAQTSRFLTPEGPPKASLKRYPSSENLTEFISAGP